MAYPSNFLRLVASGSLHDVESFSWSLSLVPDFPSGDNADGPDEVPAAAAAAVAAFHTTVSSSAAVLTSLKINEIGTNGRYANDTTTVEHDYGNPGSAGTGAPGFPPQVAVAVSLQTAASRGLAHAGRFYVPSPYAEMGTDGRMRETYATSMATAATTMIDALNATLDGWNVGVASDVRLGQFRRVTRVRVGRVFDTIRSRRTSLDEAYVQGPEIVAP